MAPPEIAFAARNGVTIRCSSLSDGGVKVSLEFGAVGIVAFLDDAVAKGLAARLTDEAPDAQAAA